jgi:hypothetical protein
MFTYNNIVAVNSNQVAYPVGLNKDSYNLVSSFIQNIETNEVTIKHIVTKNFERITLFEGTAKECLNYINEIVLIEKEWIRDDKLNYVYPNKLINLTTKHDCKVEV